MFRAFTLALVFLFQVSLSAAPPLLGETYGLDFNEEIDQSNLQQIIRGAELGRSDSIYILGLLKFYGHGMETNMEAAIQDFRQAASKGHVDAQSNLGVIYMEGIYIQQDYEVALTYLRQAADSGNSEAQWRLGDLLTHGHGMPEPNFGEAVHWYKRAAELENPKGLLKFGLMHEYGYGVLKSYKEAAKNYDLADRLGEVEATYYLALMHAYGRGFRQDFQRALLLLQKSAAMGHPPSMVELGKMLVHGQGVPVNYDMSLVWFRKAMVTQDPMASSKARQYEEEISKLVEVASESISETIRKYSAMNNP
jgi:TPR repeat protein